MRVRSSGLFKVLIIALATHMPAEVRAQGTFSLGRSLSELSPADRVAMKRARIAVLEKLQPGSISAWTDDRTGHSGEVALQRIYEKNGMLCGDVEYTLKTPDMKRFRTAFCRISDGTWRLAG
jgi:surface antigen